MNKQKREFPEVFKVQAISMLRSSDPSAADIEWELGITPGLLSRWNREKAKKEGHFLQVDRPAVHLRGAGISALIQGAAKWLR